MGIDLEELDFQTTPIGDLLLRRRRDPLLGGREVFEVKLGEHFLMSSLFTVAEEALSDLGLGLLEADGDRAPGSLEVVVGGLGLGYTAAAALAHETVGSLLVVEALGPVIDWHARGLLPLERRVWGDPRCRLVHEDFFLLARAGGDGFDPDQADRRFDAILLDIDHTPRKVLDAKNGFFYTVEGTRALLRRLKPGGVFALWSDDPPDADYEAVLATVFESHRAEVVEFPNPYRPGEGKAANTVYLARAAG